MATLLKDIPKGHVFQIQEPICGFGEYIKLSPGKVNVVNCHTWLPGYIDPDMACNWHFTLGELILKNLRKCVRSTDWELLRNQKQWLVNMDYAATAGGASDHDGEPTGLVNFLDALMDAVVADNLFTEEEVFGQEETNEA